MHFFTGTMVPQPCPNGTYTHSNQGGLQEERECLPCPPGKFCRYTTLRSAHVSRANQKHQEIRIHVNRQTHYYAQVHPVLMHTHAVHAQRQTLVSALIILTISRMQECIMFRIHGSLSSQINTLICMNIMNVNIKWEV